MIPLITLLSLFLILLLHPYINDLPLLVYLWVQTSTIISTYMITRIIIHFGKEKEYESEN